MALVVPAAPAAPRAPIAPLVTPEAADSDPQRLAWLAQAARGALDPRRHQLLLRCAVVNLVALALFGAGWMQGYIDIILAADGTYLCTLIFLIFVGGWIAALWKIAQTSRELALVHEFNPLAPSLAARYLAQVHGRAGEGRAQATADLRLKLAHGMGLVRHVANNLVLVGLIGTVLGFIISLAGVDPDRAQEASSISPMVATLIEGMSVALYTTLVGSVLHIWLMVNYHMLATGTVELVTAIAELGERHARS